MEMEMDRGSGDRNGTAGSNIAGGHAAEAGATSSVAGERRPPPPSFDCNICLDTVSSPIVTLCGHLYWSESSPSLSLLDELCRWYLLTDWYCS